MSRLSSTEFESFQKTTVLKWAGQFDQLKTLVKIKEDPDYSDPIIFRLDTGEALSLECILQQFWVKPKSSTYPPYRDYRELTDLDKYRKELFEYFFQLATNLNKPIEVFRRQGYRVWNGIEPFFFRADPGITPEERFSKMGGVLDSVVKLFKMSSQIEQVWLYGSLAARNIYARDIDLGIISSKKMAESENGRYDPVTRYCSFYSYNDCYRGYPEPIPDPVWWYLGKPTLLEVEKIAKDEGIFIDGCVFTKEVFDRNIYCCNSHSVHIGNIKKGQLVWEKKLL